MATDFEQIEFNERFHTYTLNGKQLKSVTKVCDQFKEPFDREGISRRKAEETGVSQAEILAEWDAKGAAGREKGQRVHEHIRSVLTGVGVGPTDDPFLAMNETLPEYEAFDRFWSAAFGVIGDLFRCEWVIGDEKLGVGGTVDAVFYSKVSGEYHIFDWKTNARFSVTSPWRKWLKPPFADLAECDLNYYSLQVSLYALILRRNALLPLGEMGPSYIVHLREGDFRVHRALDLSEQWEEWLEE